MGEESSVPETTIVVSVDLSSVADSVSSLSSDIQDLKSSIESMAEVQESLLVNVNDTALKSVDSTNSSLIAILIFIGIVLSFSITIWLLRK